MMKPKEGVLQTSPLQLVTNICGGGGSNLLGVSLLTSGVCAKFI